MAALRLAFVDWTFHNDEKTEAIGTLGGHNVTLTGQRTVATDPAPLGTVILNGTFPGFHTASFTPPLPASDLVEIVGLRGGSSFRVEFDAEVKDPVFHLGSLASTLEFLDLPVGTEVTRLSGDATEFKEFKVDGNKVMGKVFQPPPESTESTDSDGSVRLNGLFRSIAFTLKPRFTGGEGHDGVHLQIGGMVEAGSDMAEIRIDSSGLTFTKFSVSGHSPDLVDGAGAPMLALAPGSYGIEQIPGRPARFEFQVTQEGFVEYDAANDAFLGGRGTSTLILRGFPVTLDGRALSHDLEAFLKGSAAQFARSTAHELTLLPAEGYGFVPGPRVVVPLFDVGVDGAVHLTETVAQCGSVGVSPDGTPLVTIHGITVTIDGRALSHDLEPFLNGNTEQLPRTNINQLVLIPAQGYGFVPGPRVIVPAFDLNPDGTITLTPTTAQCATTSTTPNGTPLLTIHGITVTIDGRALSHDLEPFLNGNTEQLPRTNINQLVLIPAQGYGFVPGPRVIVPAFDLNPDGTITLTPTTAQCATTSTTPNGTPLLTIHGITVTIDGRALSHDLEPFLNGNTEQLPRTNINQLVLIPAQGYGFVPGPRVIVPAFDLNPDGTITLTPTTAQCATTSTTPNGTPLLTIHGITVTIDGRALSHDLRPFLNGNDAVLPRATAHELVLIPAEGYGFLLARGFTDFRFTVTPDGQVSLHPDHVGFAEVSGLTLTIRGFKVTVDARALSHDLTPELLGGTGTLSRATTHELTLIPSQQYMFILARGMADFHFTVTPDGQIKLDPKYAAFAEVAGRTLNLHGFKVTINAMALSHDLNPELLGWTAGPLSRTSVHELTLMPSQQYMFILARGMTDFHFTVTPDGQIKLDPKYAAFAEVAGRTLNLHGFKVTINAMALSHDLNPELLGWTAGPLSRTSVHELTLMPSQQYMFILARGMTDFHFTVTPDGQIKLDPKYAAFAEVAGRTLNLHGFKVTINAMALSHDLNPELLGWTAGPLSRTSVHELTLMPSQQYMFILARGMADFHFAVTPDGRIVLDPRYSRFAVASWRTLTISGFAVTVDGRALPHDLMPELLGWSAGVLSHSAAHQVTLIPAAVYVLTAVGVPGVRFQFSLGVDGAIVRLDGPDALVLSLAAPLPPRASPFALRRALDAARLQHDIKVIDVDAREVTLGRIHEWQRMGAPTHHPNFGGTIHGFVRWAEKNQDQRREELSVLRTQLDSADQQLTTALDAEAPLFGERTNVPIALLPVRIETKWAADNRSIKVRVYPDDIHIDAFEPALTPHELQAARAYWADPGDRAWQTLLRTVAAPRAAWATRAARPGAPAPRVRDPGRRRAPEVSTLPAQWRFLGFVDGQAVVDQTGTAIPDPLPLGLLAADESAPDHGHAQWAIDFDAAVAAGMGAVLALPAGCDHLDELFVIGVSDLPPEAGAERLRRNLHGHAFTDGLGFLSPGMPTNNTPETRSAWSSRPVPMPPGPAPAPADRTDAARLARALGLDTRTGTGPGPGDAAFLAECPGAGHDGDGPIGALSQLSWWALAFAFQSESVMLDDGSPQPDDARNQALARWLEVRTHLAEHVRSRGPLPTVRLGRQPYGFLPVTAVDEWVPDRPDGADALILPWLQRLRHHWRGALAPGWIPRVTDGTPADRIAADILSRLPVSNDFVIRRETTSRGGHEKWDGISKRAPGPTVAVAGVRSGVRWTIPSELISNLSWTSDSTEPDYSLVPKRLAPNADKYPALFDASRRHLIDAVAVLRNQLPDEQYVARWPLTPEGFPSPDRKPTIFRNFHFNTAAQKPSDFVPLMLNGDSRDVFMTHRDVFGDSTDIAFTIPHTVDRLVVLRQQGGPTVEADAARLIASVQQGLPEVDAMAAGLQALAGVAASEFLPLSFELLDVYSHRWDAWATSLATKRLSETRAAGTTGIRFGGYGWVENLYPGSAKPSDGYVHAPSLHHAATAAVLRSGYLAHRDEAPPPVDGLPQPPDGADGALSPLAVDLTSRRARTARWLLSGVRRGQNLGALLGYRFERALHDAELDREKDKFRRTFPAPVAPEPATGQPDPELWKRSSQAIAARNVVDGIALARAHAAGTVDRLLAANERPAADPLVLPLLNDLLDALDAVSDLLLAESVHQLVGGNPMRAGLAADTLGSGQHVPDRFDVLRTPHRGRAITHRIAAVLPADPPRPAGWGADLFSALEPRVDAWAAGLLGPAAAWKLAGTIKDGSVSRPFDVTLERIGFSALGLVLDAAGSTHRRLYARLGQLTQISATEVEFTRGWDELRAVAGRIQGLLAGAGPLLPAHVLDDQIGQSDLPAPDNEEVRRRVAGFVAGLADAGLRNILGIEGDLTRLKALAADATAPGWLGNVTRVLGELLGTALPLTALLPGVALPASATGTSGAAVADWVRRFGTVRPAVRTWHETLLLAGARAGRPCRLSASQLPRGGAWIGGTFEPLKRPSTRRHLVCHTPADLPAGKPIAGIVFDEWAEVLPGADALAATKTGQDPVPVESELTGVAFHFDRPDAKAPQAVLIAVPPNPVRGWTADGLALVVRDTLELAKMRTVDLADLPLIDDILPACRVGDFGSTALASMLEDFWIELAEE
ncbi:hypothetical protein OHT76_43520 [Streptomyces sp. NBC_00287]|uniref:hypothetical protein n=1 Tax=Streptomyces sp. NBC_00287 TaxID=2975702 RepID=UPI002E2D5077|nr:hypothetical protein [Streptomyces sp. NBC_00287]